MLRGIAKYIFVAIPRILFGVGWKPKPLYHLKRGERWCPVCRGHGVVGIPDIFPCPKCYGKCRLPLEAPKAKHKTPKFGGEKARSAKSDKKKHNLTSESRFKNKQRAGEETQKQPELKADAPKSSSELIFLMIIGGLVGFGVGWIAATDYGIAQYHAEVPQVAIISAAVGAVGLPLSLFLLKQIFLGLFSLVKLVLALAFITLVVLMAAEMAGIRLL